MSDKPASPFTGLKLSEPTNQPATGPDQRLFTPSLPRRSAPRPVQVTPANLPMQEPSQESRRLGTQEPGRQTPDSALPLASPESSARFDLAAPATEKNSYMFSQEELWALKDVEAELERTYRTDISKYNIVRLGLHMLLEDYLLNKGDSFLVQRLRLRPS